MTWVPYKDDFESEWDEFVKINPNGRFVYLIGFKKAIEEIYNLKSNYWLCYEDGKIKAVFPSFFHRSVLYGKRIVSQPFSEYGGILFSTDIDIEKKIKILKEFNSVIENTFKEKYLDYLEIRCFSDLKGLNNNLFEKVPLYYYGILKLDRNLNLSKLVDYSVRKNIKKAIRNNLKVVAGNSEVEIKNIFYPLHLKSLKRLGSPPQPLEYFLSLQKNLKDYIKIFFAKYKENYISALLGWTVGDSAHITDISSDEKYFDLRGNDLIHYEFIKWAAENGYKYFDFGPVRYPGQRQYKVKWGISLLEYSNYYLSVKKIKKPLSDKSYFVKIGSGLWKLIVPVKLSAKIGKYFRKELSI
ncbi:MAG: GNAT family N-acetyltransferase [Acidobacteriota bacterium]